VEIIIRYSRCIYILVKFQFKLIWHVLVSDFNENKFFSVSSESFLATSTVWLTTTSLCLLLSHCFYHNILSFCFHSSHVLLHHWCWWNISTHCQQHNILKSKLQIRLHIHFECSVVRHEKNQTLWKVAFWNSFHQAQSATAGLLSETYKCH